MKKITTLFKVIYEGRQFKEITNETREENRWVFTESNVLATRKYDGTACMVKDNCLYRRYDAKKGRQAPEGAIPCCPPDLITGHHPHWIKCEIDNPSDKYHLVAFTPNMENGTYELCGEKIQGNPENIKGHMLIPHGIFVLNIDDWTFNGFKNYLAENDIEGIVFHGQNGKMCKLRKSDYGIKR